MLLAMWSLNSGYGYVRAVPLSARPAGSFIIFDFHYSQPRQRWRFWRYGSGKSMAISCGGIRIFCPAISKIMALCLASLLDVTGRTGADHPPGPAIPYLQLFQFVPSSVEVAFGLKIFAFTKTRRRVDAALDGVPEVTSPPSVHALPVQRNPAREIACRWLCSQCY